MIKEPPSIHEQIRSNRYARARVKNIHKNKKKCVKCGLYECICQIVLKEWV